MLSSVMVWVVHLIQIDDSAVFKTRLPLCTENDSLRHQVVYIPKSFWQTRKNVAGTICVKQMYGLFLEGGMDFLYIFFWDRLTPFVHVK